MRHDRGHLVSVPNARLRRKVIAVFLSLSIVGCSKATKSGPQGVGGSAGSLAGLSGAGASAGRSAGSSGATESSLGRAGSSGGPSVSTAGHAGGSATSRGAAGSAGQGDMAGMGAGGAQAGAGGAGAAGASVNAGDCTRDLLKGTVDKYFVALAAHDASSLPQAASLKFTENAKAATLGDGLVWKTAGMVKFTRNLLDTERCGSVTEAVIPNSGMDTIYGLRLRLENQKVTEIETIVVDPVNGFPAPLGIPPMPAAIISSKSDAWEDLLPPEQRSTRDQLETAGKAYFASFGDSSTQVPYGMPCDRLENGLKTTSGDCSNFGGAVGINQPAQRYPVTDLEAGITAGFILFAGGDIDFHMFKLIGGKIRWINAVVGPAVTSQGWQ
jgi:hypothetical protein